MSNPSSQVRVRFAPSPTGALHIGGVRAALFNWLFARNQGGKFLLRIEDTDLERSEERHTQDIMACMRWLGLTWDEEPLFQSKRLGIYLQKAEGLVAHGHAYKCWCTEAEVEQMREKAMASGAKPMYDRRCRDRKDAGPADAPYVIRAKIPLGGSITFQDLIRGPIEFANADIDDFVLIRSNGAPTYNLSNVVDDVESRMTHVVRGDDHINNTPKQMHLYQFFKYPVPLFAHLPMILGPDKKKLSKRNGVVSANAYRADGYLPEALLNFLARLGWSHGDQELFTVEEMIRFFSFDHVQVSSGVFNAEKLVWVNAEHLKKADPKRLAGILAEDFAAQFTASGALDVLQSELGLKLIALVQPKMKTLKEMAEQIAPLCSSGTFDGLDTSGLKWQKDPALKPKTQAAVAEIVSELAGKAGALPTLAQAGMGHAEVDAFLRQIGDKHGVKLGDLTQPMRLTVTGRAQSAAGLFDLLPLLPWKTLEARLKAVSAL
jgi:glutamyl-tRNA synthetase